RRRTKRPQKANLKAAVLAQAEKPASEPKPRAESRVLKKTHPEVNEEDDATVEVDLKESDDESRSSNKITKNQAVPPEAQEQARRAQKTQEDTKYVRKTGSSTVPTLSADHKHGAIPHQQSKPSPPPLSAPVEEE